MLKRKLSDTYIASLKPAARGKRYDVYDETESRLVVRVTDKGSKSLQLFARFPGRTYFERRLIGKHPAVSIAEARSIARRWKELLRNGHDPEVVAEEARLAAVRAHQHTFREVAENYFTFIHGEGHRKARTVEREVRSTLVAAWGDRAVASITLHDVRSIITPIVRRGAKYHAHTVFAYARGIFRWAIGTGAYGLQHSPCDHLQPKNLIGKKASRRRVLDDHEIRALWAATARLGDPRLDGFPWCGLIRVLLLTGCRRTEVSDAKWGEFDLDQRVFTIPEARFKSGSVHVVPLSADAAAIVAGLPRPKYPRGEHVFSTTLGHKPVDGFSNLKARLDVLMREELRKLRGDDAELAPWVLHDLRRTVRTRLAWLGTPEVVAERIIGHAPRDQLQRIYNRHEYIDERRAALEKWATALREIVASTPPEADNVTPLHRVRVR